MQAHQGSPMNTHDLYLENIFLYRSSAFYYLVVFWGAAADDRGTPGIAAS